MAYIKGTEQQCIDYNAEVTRGENYQNSSDQWDAPIQCVGYWAITFNPKYPSSLPVVESIDIINTSI